MDPRSLDLGGNTTGAVRVGNTVRRRGGPWTAAVHAVLEHVHQRGLASVPRPLGMDELGREVLSMVPGEPVEMPPPPWIFDHECLATTGGFIRAIHDATMDFIPPTGMAWRQLPGAPSDHEVICRNDIAPYNLLYAVAYRLDSWTGTSRPQARGLGTSRTRCGGAPAWVPTAAPWTSRAPERAFFSTDMACRRGTGSQSRQGSSDPR